MHISLSPELESLIQEKVRSGFYSNASEVVRDALRKMHERDSFHLLQREVSTGFSQLQEGHGVPFDLEKAKQTARANAKAGKKVRAAVTPHA